MSLSTCEGLCLKTPGAESDRDFPSQCQKLLCNIGVGVFNRSSKQLKEIKEPRTGYTFPGELCLSPKTHACPRITGVGARQKRLAGIKSLDIYAVGLYADHRGVRSLLHSKASKSTEEAICKDDAVFSALVKDSGIEKALRIVITSGLVKRKSFIDALDAKLKPAVRSTKSEKTLEDFCSMFDSVAFRKGLEVNVFFNKGDMVTTVDGREIGRLKDKRFCEEFLNMYIGKDPVSAKAKEEMGRGLYRMACPYYNKS